jgi:UDP-glucose 4-epimerase
MTETSTPHPISPYGVTKLAAEHLCHLYWKSYGLPTISLRFFTVYGPRQRPDMAISKFLNAIIMKQPITIYGDGNQTRDFTFVSDVVDANILAALKGNPGAVYNVGGGNKISVVNLVKLLGSICDSSPQMIFQPPQRGDAQDTLADTTLIKKDLDWNPKIDIENGLKIFVEWYKCRSY